MYRRPTFETKACRKRVFGSRYSYSKVTEAAIHEGMYLVSQELCEDALLGLIFFALARPRDLPDLYE